MKQPWFGVKRYGIGLGPRSPMGWATIAVYAVLMAAAHVPLTALHAPASASGIAAATLTAAFLVLIALKSDGRPWRWRDRD